MNGYTHLSVGADTHILLLLCLPAVLAFPRPAGQERKEDRTEGTDDGEIDKEEEEGDELEGGVFSSGPHCGRAAGTGRSPEHGQRVSARVYVCYLCVHFMLGQLLMYTCV